MVRFLVWLLVAMPALAQQGFYPFSIEQDKVSGAADFSFLNHPLTAADRLFARDGHFYRVGADLKPGTADDERVRLFGVNFAFGASFPEPPDAPRIAKRLRRLGVNLVRLHHMDSSPDRDPENCRSTLTTGPYPTLNAVSVKRLRVFLNALKAEGIYANLNLHVGYTFRPNIDNVPALPDGQPIPTQSKPLHIFYPRMVALQVKYTRDLIAALELKGDPVLGMVEADNETSLLESYQRGALDKVLAGEYRAEFDRQWNKAFERFDSVVPPLAAGEKPEGPRARQIARFLAGTDRAYLRAMLEAVRQATDALVPVTGTQMGYGGLLNLDSHIDMDYQDNHFYIDHPNFPHQRWDSRDWRIRDSSSVGSGMTSFVNMAVTRVAGQPYTVSEFNQPWPNRQAAEIDPTLAAFGAFQDWDALMHFAYAHGREWENLVPGGFNINGDWGKYPNIGQSAWLFRSGAVAAGKQAVTIPVTEEMQVNAFRQRRVGAVASFLKDSGAFDPAVAFLHPVALHKADQAGAPPPPAALPYRSDTGELIYDLENKVYVLEAARAAGVYGFAGTRKIAAGAVELELAPSARGFIALTVTPLDGKALGDARKLLVSLPGATFGTVPRSDPPRMQKLVLYPETKDWYTLEPEAGAAKPSANLNGGAAPVWMERVECHLTLRSSAKGLSVYPLDGAGARLAALPASAVVKQGGGFRIHIQADGQQFAPWYEILAK
jgi:hypothetical protein